MNSCFMRVRRNLFCTLGVDMLRIAQIMSTFFVGSLVQGCGSDSLSFSSSQEIAVEIFGVHRATEEAPGTTSPRAIAMTFEKLVLVDENGTESELAPDETEEVSVISRPQIVFKESLKDYEGTVISSITAHFSKDTTATGKYKVRPLELATGTYATSKEFTVSKAKSYTMTIELEWLNTAVIDDDAADEVFVEPDAEVSLIEN
jgi:hypothetical protein